MEACVTLLGGIYMNGIMCDVAWENLYEWKHV